MMKARPFRTCVSAVVPFFRPRAAGFGRCCSAFSFARAATHPKKAVSTGPENLSDSSIYKCLQNQCNLNQALAAPEIVLFDHLQMYSNMSRRREEVSIADVSGIPRVLLVAVKEMNGRRPAAACIRCGRRMSASVRSSSRSIAVCRVLNASFTAFSAAAAQPSTPSLRVDRRKAWLAVGIVIDVGLQPLMRRSIAAALLPPDALGRIEGSGVGG